MPFTEKWCSCNIRPAELSRSQPCPIHMRHNGNAASRDQMGLSTHEGELLGQLVSASDHFEQGTVNFGHFY